MVVKKGEGLRCDDVCLALLEMTSQSGSSLASVSSRETSGILGFPISG